MFLQTAIRSVEKVSQLRPEMMLIEFKVLLKAVEFLELTMMRSVEVRIVSDFRVKILRIVK